jgi:hypothetical protein
MLTGESKVMDKELPSGGRDCGNSGRYKDTGGNNTYKKPRFVGECDELKECIFDCEDSKQAGMFNANIKNYQSMQVQNTTWDLRS